MAIRAGLLQEEIRAEVTQVEAILRVAIQEEILRDQRLHKEEDRKVLRAVHKAVEAGLMVPRVEGPMDRRAVARMVPRVEDPTALKEDRTDRRAVVRMGLMVEAPMVPMDQMHPVVLQPVAHLRSKWMNV